MRQVPVGAVVGSCGAAAAAGLTAGAGEAATGAGALAVAAAGAAAAACAGAGAAPAEPSRIAIRSPMLTVSPTLTFSSFSTPAADDGISIEALSDSTVISDWSAAIVSPGFTSSSMTATSLKSPMSGTLTSTGPEAAGAAAGAGAAAAGAGAAAAAAGAAAGAGAGAAAAPSASSTSTTEPSFTLPPTATLISFTTPAVDDGISIEALSDSTVMSDCSALTVSPTFTSTSITATSSKSPMSGTLTSTAAISFVSRREAPFVR
jgi:hypothetical protein